MLETLTRHWWVLAVRGGAAVLFGLLALIWPGITILALVLLFGAYALVDGVLALYTALSDRPAAQGRRGWLARGGVGGGGAAGLAGARRRGGCAGRDRRRGMARDHRPRPALPHRGVGAGDRSRRDRRG